MEQNPTRSKGNAKDFILNLGAIVALYTIVGTLIDLLFTVIDSAYPPITSYYYAGTQTISWPVATLIIFFPIFIALMWLLEKEYRAEPDRKDRGIHKWLTYITLFISGLLIAGDLITVLYYFIDGQELTTGFLLKVLVLLVVAVSIFVYYISDVRDRLTSKSRMTWRVVSAVIIVASIAWGFAVLGSPRTQRLYKYDDQKVSDLQTINSEVMNYYAMKGSLPSQLSDLANGNNYYVAPVDPETQQPYEYDLTGQSAKAYSLCADFNKPSAAVSQPNVYLRPVGYETWNHPAGHYCFEETVPVAPTSSDAKLPM